MKRLIRFIKYIPLLLVGVAVIAWGMFFRQKSDDGSMTPSQGGDDLPPIFPY